MLLTSKRFIIIIIWLHQYNSLEFFTWQSIDLAEEAANISSSFRFSIFLPRCIRSLRRRFWNFGFGWWFWFHFRRFRNRFLFLLLCFDWFIPHRLSLLGNNILFLGTTRRFQAHSFGGPDSQRFFIRRVLKIWQWDLLGRFFTFQSFSRSVTIGLSVTFPFRMSRCS